MRSIQALKLLPIWVDPAHLVSTARIVMHGHGLKAIAVLESGRLVGTVTSERLAAAPEFSEVREFIEPLGLVIEGDLSARQVAEQFVLENADYAPATLDDRFLGIVTSTMLLRELGRSWDPLTGLSWSDALREWGIENLRRNNEVTILFIDLNEFGLYNKRYGHIVGDKVLRQVAATLQSSMDQEQDVLVRYGGDEFAIGTIRSHEETGALIEVLKLRTEEVSVPETADEVSFAIGRAGGKRSKERDNIHYAATLDNLINLASKDCLAHKKHVDPSPTAVVEIEEPPAEAADAVMSALAGPQPIQLIGVLADEQSTSGVTTVILNVGENVVSGVQSRSGRSLIESIATATAKSLELGFPGRAVRVEDIHLAEGPGGMRLVSVSGELSDGQRTVPIGGVAKVGQDLYSSVAEATIQAFCSAGGNTAPVPGH